MILSREGWEEQRGYLSALQGPSGEPLDDEGEPVMMLFGQAEFLNRARGEAFLLSQLCTASRCGGLGKGPITALGETLYSNCGSRRVLAVCEVFLLFCSSGLLVLGSGIPMKQNCGFLTWA